MKPSAPETPGSRTEPTPSLPIVLAAVAWASACVVFSFAPWDLWPLAFVAFVPFLEVAPRLTTRRLFFMSWLLGLLMNLGGFHWVVGLVRNFGDMPTIAGIAVLLLLCSQQALIYALAFLFARWVEQGTRISVLWALPIGIIAAEALMPLVFPWRLGHSQVPHLAFLQSVELGGVMLTSGLVLLVNTTLHQLWHQWRERPQGTSPVAWVKGWPIALQAAVLLLVVNELFGFVRIHQVRAEQERAETLRIGLAEADISIEDKWNPRLYPANLLQHHRLSVELAEQGAELIVWPESAYEQNRFFYQREGDPGPEFWPVIHRDVRYFPQSEAPPAATVEEDWATNRALSTRVAPQRGFTTPLLAGVSTMRLLDADEARSLPPSGRGTPRQHLNYNSALMLDERGQVLGIADKYRMMPISEEIPGAAALWRLFGINLYAIVPASGMFGKADGPTVLTLPLADEREQLRIGIMNCYEDLMPRFARGLQRQNPDVLINMTNDAWFGRTTEPFQHLALAIPRAIEQRTWLIRSTNTGISAFVDATGRIVSQSAPYEAEWLLEETPMMPSRNTPFMAIGNWPAWVSICLVVVGLIRRRREETQS